MIDLSKSSPMKYSEWKFVLCVHLFVSTQILVFFRLIGRLIFKYENELDVCLFL